MQINMRNKKLISMFLLPAVLVACNNDEFVDDFDRSEAKEVVEGFTLNVSLSEDAETRGAYAGGTEGVFKNFYLEPEYGKAAEEGKLALSDNENLRGDMVGLCLTNGGNAITNLPFYIAGYGSAKADTESAMTKIFTFADQTNKLYNLGLDANTQEENNALYVAGADQKAKALIEASAAAIANKKETEALDADVMDVRKGIMRSNAGVMTGNYVAYYPYNEAFTEPEGIPVKNLGSAIVEVTNLSTDVEEAISAAGFYDKMFACSEGTIEINGSKKAGSVSLKPVTGAIVFKIYNTGTEKSKTIKLITVKATENSAATDFALNGKMTLGATNTFVAGNQTTDMVGVSFGEEAIDGNTATENAKFAMIPVYYTAEKNVTVSVYTTDNKVAVLEKKKSIPGNGKAVTYTIDMKELEFKEAPQYVYNEQSFRKAMAAKGTLIMLSDITLNSGSSAVTFDNDLTIQGAHTLTIEKGTEDAKINANLTFEEGAKLALQGGVAVTKKLKCGEMTVSGTPTFTGATIEATSMAIAAGATVATLADATIGTLENKGTFTTAAATGKSVNVTTLNNESSVTVAKGTTLTVATLNNKAVAGTAAAVVVEAGENQTAAGKLVATNVTNEAAVTGTPGKTAGTITVSGETSAATVDNKGTLTWSSAKEMNLKVTNSGTFAVNEGCRFTGTLNNSNLVTIAVDKTIEGTAGSIENNANGVMTVNGSLILTGTALNIKAGIVNNVGSVNGASKITVAEGAEFVKTVNARNDLIAALGTTGIPGKYTGVNVATAITDLTATDDISTSKKIYLAANLTIAKACELKGDVEVTKNATLTTTELVKISNITVNAGKKLTIGDSSNIEVSGTITNNGTYEHGSGNSAVVYCGGIAGEGTWTNYPIF